MPVNAKLFGPFFPDAVVVAAKPVADGSALPAVAALPDPLGATAAGAVAGLPSLLELFAELGRGNAISEEHLVGRDGRIVRRHAHRATARRRAGEKVLRTAPYERCEGMIAVVRVERHAPAPIRVRGRRRGAEVTVERRIPVR